jgi:hypothetical protein
VVVAVAAEVTKALAAVAALLCMLIISQLFQELVII